MTDNSLIAKGLFAIEPTVTLSDIPDRALFVAQDGYNATVFGYRFGELFLRIGDDAELYFPEGLKTRANQIRLVVL